LICSIAVALALIGGCQKKKRRIVVTPAYFALDYLTDSTYTDLLVEVDYVDGCPPRQAALDRLRERLIERCNKNRITVIRDDAMTANIQSVYTVQDIANLEAFYRDFQTGGATAVLYVTYLNGASSFDTASSQVLGLAYLPSSIALFKENIDSSAYLTISATEIERAVLVHELGHQLGLVNNGTTMVNDHEARNSMHHCTQYDCVMYYELDTTDFRYIVAGTIPDQFCAYCRADLKHAGGK
jgi:hypothetical protein